jgi:hypothetical protein
MAGYATFWPGVAPLAMEGVGLLAAKEARAGSAKVAPQLIAGKVFAINEYGLATYFVLRLRRPKCAYTEGRAAEGTCNAGLCR